jgi:ribosomal protein S18 acetylase RimI-like enzyme
MRSRPQQRQYLVGLNRSMPGSSSDMETLVAFLETAVWPTGNTVAAFAGDLLVGNVMMYWDPPESERAGKKVGVTEDIWVLPEWRGRGIATAMISRALSYLSDKGFAEARLQVAAPNEGALRLYSRLGYEVIAESQILRHEL